MKTELKSLCMLLVLSFFACKEKKTEEPEKKETEITEHSFSYKFTDSSMPPQYHRSYVITVKPGWVYLTVDSYGDILLNDTATLSETVYQNFAASIDKLNIKTRKDEPGEGCDGGTTDEFDLYSGTGKQVKGYSAQCAGKRNGNIEGDVEAAIALFKAIVPDFSKKIESTRKEG